MFRIFFGFELRYWLTRFMLYIFLFIIIALVLGATSSDNVRIGGALDNSYRNAPYVIQTFYSILAIFSCMMTTAFVNDAASRDFAYGTSQLLFSKPISKWAFLMGRFWGSVLIAMVPLFGITLAMLITPYMPWNDDPTKFGPVNWSAHFWGIIAWALPNTIFIAAFVFAVSIWLRSTFASFIGIIVLLVFYGISQSIAGNLDNETLSQLADPFGAVAFLVQTKYWTVADKNSAVLTFGNSMLLYNRLIWLGVGLSILAIACWRFSFAERRSRSKKLAVSELTSTAVAIPASQQNFGIFASLQQLGNQFKIDFFSTIKSPVFLVIIFGGMIDTFMSMRMAATEGFGLSSLPVTYKMIDVIRGSLFVYLLAIIVFYSGVLVWKEREAKLDEVYDAMPYSTWISFAAKLLALLLIVVLVMFAEVLMGIVTQAMAGYHRYQVDVYFKELFLISFVWIFCFTVLAMLCHVISANKYIGYFAFIVLATINTFVWGWLEIESNLIRFTRLPAYVYSDMFAFKPFSTGLSWFGIYWVLFGILLSCLGVLMWQRGRERGPRKRIPIALRRLRGSAGVATLTTFLVWAGVGAWAFYNTEVVNTYAPGNEVEKLQVKYEVELKEVLTALPQPRITSVKHAVDLYPHKRGLVFKGQQTIKNFTDGPIEKLVLNIDDDYENVIEVENAKLFEEHEDLGVQIYKFDPPMQPGDELQMEYTVSYEAKGFENSVSKIELVQNGTFFNNMIAPQIGYQKSRELSDKDDRKEHGLGEPVIMPPLEPNNLAARRNTYLTDSSDWIEIETVISTSADQVAIAPGSLIKKWTNDGRRYFHYRVDQKALNFYSFISADYAVELRDWNGVDIEVYYHKDHRWNVDKMLRSVRMSLEYYSKNFGPYKHKQARIIEFPRTATFAQAFPGTMPYSEGIGFIADIKDDNDIDMVYYVVAHEMAHQWWAHQVIGANMLGATVLSETLAQYSALMVMEKEYGRDMMRKFLKHEMNSYLSARGTESLKERPLKEVAARQGYIHYNKGSVVMYCLKEMIGEDKVNAALKSLVDRFAYQSHPYPTSQDLVDALKVQTPTELHYLLNDLFDHITLFENRTVETKYSELGSGKYEVTVDIECHKFQADDDGEQTEIEVDDWIEIGAFAKPEADSEYGKTLHRQRVRITQPFSSFTFEVDEIPAIAGVDPFLLLIDRFPEDNMKKPSQQ